MGRGFPSPSCSCGIEMRCVSLTTPRGRRNAAFQETPRPVKHLMEHGARELPREGVLLARMVTSEEGHPRLETVLRAVRELGPRPPRLATELAPRGEKAVEGDSPESHHDPNVLESLKLSHQITPAGFHLFPRRFVVGGRAARDGADISIFETKPVVARDGVRRRRERESMEGFVEPIPAPIPGEHPTGAIATVSRRSEAHNEEPRARGAEARDGLSPVLLRLEASGLHESDALTVADETGTLPATNHLVPEKLEAHSLSRARIPSLPTKYSMTM